MHDDVPMAVPIYSIPFHLIVHLIFVCVRLQVLEWNGMSLVDRSFEEVCAIMDRTGDTVELLVEHAADFRMCDLLDDPAPSNSGAGSGGSNLRKSMEDSSSGLAPGKNFFFFVNFH